MLERTVASLRTRRDPRRGGRDRARPRGGDPARLRDLRPRARAETSRRFASGCWSSASGPPVASASGSTSTWITRWRAARLRPTRSSPTCPNRTIPRVTRRELALLLPLLALYVAAWAFFPERPDDEASYVVLAERLVDGLLRHRGRRRDPERRSGKPGPLVRARPAGAPRAARRRRRAAVAAPPDVRARAVRRGAADVRPRPRAVGSRASGSSPRTRSGSTSRSSGCSRTCTARCSPSSSSSWGCSGSRASSIEAGLVWLVVGAAGLAGLALTRVAYGWVLTVALLVLLVWWLVRRSRRDGPSGRGARARARALPAVARLHVHEDRPASSCGATRAASRSTG